MNRLDKYFSIIDSVNHTTFDPKGPGVIRIHLVPPKNIRNGVPWVVVVNGENILPVNTAWGVIINELIKGINSTNGRQLTDEDFKALMDSIIKNVSKVYPFVPKKIIKEDTKDIIDVLVAIANRKKPHLDIGYLTLKEYAENLRAPLRMDLMVSAMEKDGVWNCNQKCVHCYAANQKFSNVKSLSTNDWLNIIDKLYKAGVTQLTFTGGEATLREDLVTLVEHSKYFVTRLNTNGVLLSKKLCEELYNASLDNVQITLYSSDPSIHNILTGSNNYNKTIEGIKNAIEAGLNVSINTPLCALNKDYKKTLEFLKELGVVYFTCSSIIETGNATLDESVKTRLTSNELLTIVKDAKEYCNNNNLYMDFTTPGAIDKEELEKNNMNNPICGACLSNMAIAPNGDVMPCQSYLSYESLGNLKNESWKTIWESNKTKNIRDRAIRIENGCLLSSFNGDGNE